MGYIYRRIFDGKVEIETGDGYHTIIFVHHDHASRSHHGTDCQQVVEVDGSIQMFLPVRQPPTDRLSVRL